MMIPPKPCALAAPKKLDLLLAALGEDPVRLRELADVSEFAYVVRKKRRSKSGRSRWIYAPSEELKAVQSRLSALLQPLIASPIAYEITGRGYVAAAQRHVGAEWVAKLDIRDFFESLTVRHVREWALDYGFTGEAAAFLVRLTTCRGILPSGAPTSNALACLILASMDVAVQSEANRLGVIVTRVTDDFHVSGNSRSAVCRVARFIVERLYRLRLLENSAKYSLLPGRDALVHGLRIYDGVRLTKSNQKRRRDMVRRIERYGCTPGEFCSLQGHLGLLTHLHPDKAQ